MNKHLKGVIAAAMTVTMMAAAAAPAGSMLTAITPVKSITASASLSGEYDFSTKYTYVDSDGCTWKYCLNSAKTKACIWLLSTCSVSSVTVPDKVPNPSGSGMIWVRAIDEKAINGRTNITRVALPSGLQKLDAMALNNLKYLDTVALSGNQLTSYSANSINACPNFCKAEFKNVSINTLEFFNPYNLTNLIISHYYTNGTVDYSYQYPIFQVIAGDPCFCPSHGITTYITNNHWKFWDSSWMKSYISSKAHYIAMTTSYTADNDTEHIGNIFKYIDNAADENRTKVTNNKRYNGDTAFFFEPAMADSLGCAKAFDLIANAAGYESQILKVGTSINNPYVFLNTVTYQGKVYTIDAMHSSCMEDFDHLKAHLGNYLPSHRYYLSPAELDSPLHTSHFDPQSPIGNEFLAVPYRFLGDVNEDGSFNWTDCNMITDYMNGTRTLNADQKFRADFNMDGVINYSDVTAIRAKYGF